MKAAEKRRSVSVCVIRSFSTAILRGVCLYFRHDKNIWELEEK